MKAGMDSGKTYFMSSTLFYPDSGHIIGLEKIIPGPNGGIVINDSYGYRNPVTGVYTKNPQTNGVSYGLNKFYTWKEAEKYNIGTWSGNGTIQVGGQPKPK